MRGDRNRRLIAILRPGDVLGNRIDTCVIFLHVICLRCPGPPQDTMECYRSGQVLRSNDVVSLDGSGGKQLLFA